MLRIGEFSRFSRISIRMLRHYDAAGVLKPAALDEATGYRFYTVEQLAQANRVKTLRDLGFNVREIARLMTADTERLAVELRRRDCELANEAARVQAGRAALAELLHAVEAGESQHAFEVEMKRVPAYHVVTLRMTLADYDEERLAWERLGALMHARGIAPSDPYVEFCEFPDEEGADGGVVVEVSVAVDAHDDDADGLRFRNVEAVPQAASIMVGGPYERIAGAYASFAQWLEDHPRLRTVGPVREIAHRGPWNADDPADYLTELLAPVEEIASGA